VLRGVRRGRSQTARPIMPYLILFTAFCLVGLLVTCALLLS
jgi:hypothetical protein